MIFLLPKAALIGALFTTQETTRLSPFPQMWHSTVYSLDSFFIIARALLKKGQHIKNAWTKKC